MAEKRDEPEAKRSALLQLPDDVLNTIAYELASGTSPYKPPTALVPFLSTCRHLRDNFGRVNNSRLYAQLFAENYDTAAPRRRFKTDDLTARGFAAEYVRRIVALKRLNAAVKAERADLVLREDLWTIYLMLLENDGKNIRHLTNASSGQPLIGFLKLYHDSILVKESTERGIPAGNVDHTLVFWLIWLITDQDSVIKQDRSELEELLFILRPYVFAVKFFDIAFAPWTIQKLPVSKYPSNLTKEEHLEQLGFSEADQEQMEPFFADLDAKSRMASVELYGVKQRLTIPLVAQAAILNFFSRLDYSTSSMHSEAALAFRQSMNAAGGGQQLVVWRPRQSNRPPVLTTIESSRNHDVDFRRMISCYDARTSPGMRLADWKGRIAGGWEGNFSFMDFDVFRDMLSGDWTSHYNAEFGEQSQVWRMYEVIVRKKRSAPRASEHETDDAPAGAEGKEIETISRTAETSAEADEPEDISALNAGFPARSTSFDKVPLDPRRTHRGSTAAAANVAAQLDSDKQAEIIRAVLGGLKGYDVLEDGPELEEAMNGPDEGDLEMLLVGSGHSAWGEFILRGRLRLWDGLITLSKEYSPDGRGRWLYRGHVVTDKTLVGRWRDTYSPEPIVGYEGTFQLTRRSDIESAEAAN